MPCGILSVLTESRKYHVGKPNFKNRTAYHGDNLMFLRSMNTGSVHLIATDPPFNKGRDFHATPDSLTKGASFQDRWSWETDVHQEWVDQITDDHPRVMNVVQGSRSSYGDDMGAFLCFMAVRLLAMRRVLREDGSIYLHCDPTASHYLKELMDAVFGRKNFRNEIVWHYNTGGKGKSQFLRKHDLHTKPLGNLVRRNVDCSKTILMTDEYMAYTAIGREMVDHMTVNHSAGEFKRGNACTNEIEGLWATVKRAMVGQFHKVSAQYLPLYLNEITYRYNRRRMEQTDAFDDLLARAVL